MSGGRLTKSRATISVSKHRKSLILLLKEKKKLELELEQSKKEFIMFQNGLPPGRSESSTLTILYGKNTYSVTVTGSNTGCGLGILTNITSNIFSGHPVYGTNSSVPIDILVKFVKIIRTYALSKGYGAVIATLGDTYLRNCTGKYEERMINAGFEIISNYTNFKHGTTAYQKLFILYSDNNSKRDLKTNEIIKND